VFVPEQTAAFHLNKELDYNRGTITDTLLLMYVGSKLTTFFNFFVLCNKTERLQFTSYRKNTRPMLGIFPNSKSFTFDNS
jgi:hypothetical protein